MARFELFLPTLLKHEGGFVNHPLDPGGATNKGIILVNWQRWGRDIDKDGDIDVEDLKKITDQDVINYYVTHFWNKIKASEFLSQDVANIVFDMYVNATSIGIPLLQFILNRNFGKKLSVDGAVGPNTLEAINSVDPDALHDLYKKGRIKYYDYRTAQLAESDPYYAFFWSLGVRPRADQIVFYKTWIRRSLSFLDKKKVLLSAGGWLWLGSDL